MHMLDSLRQLASQPGTQAATQLSSIQHPSQPANQPASSAQLGAKSLRNKYFRIVIEIMLVKCFQ